MTRGAAQSLAPQKLRGSSADPKPRTAAFEVHRLCAACWRFELDGHAGDCWPLSVTGTPRPGILRPRYIFPDSYQATSQELDDAATPAYHPRDISSTLVGIMAQTIEEPHL